MLRAGRRGWDGKGLIAAAFPFGVLDDGAGYTLNILTATGLYLSKAAVVLIWYLHRESKWSPFPPLLPPHAPNVKKNLQVSAF